MTIGCFQPSRGLLRNENRCIVCSSRGDQHRSLNGLVWWLARGLWLFCSRGVETERHTTTSLLFKSCAIEIKGWSDVQLAWYQIAQWRGTALVRLKGKTFVPISQMSIKCPKWWTNFEIHCNKIILFQDWQVLPHLLPDSLLHIQHHLLACFYTLDQLYTTSLYFRGQKIIVTTKVCFLFTVLHLLFSQL